jgi:hypothetical protein
MNKGKDQTMTPLIANLFLNGREAWRKNWREDPRKVPH